MSLYVNFLSLSFKLFHLAHFVSCVLFFFSSSLHFTIHGDSFKSMLLKRDRLKRKGVLMLISFMFFCLWLRLAEERWRDFIVLTFLKAICRLLDLLFRLNGVVILFVEIATNSKLYKMLKMFAKSNLKCVLKFMNTRASLADVWNNINYNGHANK